MITRKPSDRAETPCVQCTMRTSIEVARTKNPKNYIMDRAVGWNIAQNFQSLIVRRQRCPICKRFYKSRGYTSLLRTMASLLPILYSYTCRIRVEYVILCVCRYRARLKPRVCVRSTIRSRVYIINRHVNHSRRMLCDSIMYCTLRVCTGKPRKNGRKYTKSALDRCEPDIARCCSRAVSCTFPASRSAYTHPRAH